MTSQQPPEHPDPNPWQPEDVAGALTSARVRGVRLWPTTPQATVIAEGASLADWQFAELDTSGVTDKAGYIQACADQLRLPDYLGHNWDALEEALGDLGVAAAKSSQQGVLILWQNWKGLATADPAAFQVALAVWRSVVADWRERLPGAAVALGLQEPQIAPAGLPESIIEELTGMSRVRAQFAPGS